MYAGMLQQSSFQRPNREYFEKPEKLHRLYKSSGYWSLHTVVYVLCMERYVGFMHSGQLSLLTLEKVPKRK